jgi:F0F1-type ATP synthase membrane subunit b/b'
MEPLKMNTAARLVAATLALVAVIYTVNVYLVKAKTEYFEKEIEHIDERLDKLEAKHEVTEKEVAPSAKEAAK